MIVAPDFADHWKTRHVVKKIGSEAAVRCILRLWGHCQLRRRWVYPDMKPEILAAICGWDGDPEVLWTAMLETFLDSTDGGIEVHGWAETNASLVSNWDKGQYGKLGGRPPKTPQGFPRVSAEKPALTLGEPEKRREEKIREDISEAKASSSAAGAADPVQYEWVRELFHELCPSLPKLRGMPVHRKAAVRCRWKDASGQALARFEELFRIAEASDFLSGRDGRWGACSFDWLMSAKNAQKVLEGNYTNHDGSPTKNRRYDN